MLFYFGPSSTRNPHFTCSSLPGMTEFGGFFHDIFKSQSYAEGLGAWEGHAVGLEEMGYQHTCSPLGLPSCAVWEHELLPPAPLNPFSSLSTWRTELPDTHHFISPDWGTRPLFLSLLPQAPSVFMLAICRGGGKGMRWRIHDSSSTSRGKSNPKAKPKGRAQDSIS